MNKREKEVFEGLLDQEDKVLHDLARQYKRALADINDRIKLLQSDEMTQSRIHQVNYQKMLKQQVEAILEKLHGDEHSAIQKYLDDSYTNAFVGTMYAMQGQGIPIITPIDRKAAVKAIVTDSKLSEDLYTSLGHDMGKLKKHIREEITRGIATSLPYAHIARNISSFTNLPLSNAKRIVRTEGHRIQQTSADDARNVAKSKGADVVKQWDASLDMVTRPIHRELDGQIRETEDTFDAGGYHVMYPGAFGVPSQDCNCRCVALTRARWALDEKELETLKERAAYFGLDKTADFEDYKNKYLKAAKTIENTGKSGIMKKGNTEVRKWYLDSVSRIAASIDRTLPIADQAKQAFEARNRIRTEARNMMADEETRKLLDKERPNKTFEELVESKMQRKGMTREEAIADILKTATKTNANVNRELGLDGD